MPMATSHPLATESFSCSWLSNVNPSLDGLDEPIGTSVDSSHEAISRGSDFKKLKSKRFEDAQNFDFDIPLSPVSLVHADQLFSNGLIKPIFVDPSKIEHFNASDSITILPGSSFSSRNGIPNLRDYCHFFIRLRKSPKRILQKCFGYLRRFCHKVGSSRRSIKVVDIDRKVWEVKRWSNSPQASPQRSIDYSVGNWCDSESSVYEAILHCKRSIEN